MIANKCFLIALHLLVTYHVAKTFVILSANIDDVRKLAKEFSGPLTDEIVKIILKATKNVSLDSSHKNEANTFTSNTIKPIKKKHKHYKKQILRNNFQQVEIDHIYPDGVQDRNTPKYAYAVSPKIAEVNTEVKTTCTTPVSNKDVLQSYHAVPQTVDKTSNTLDDNVVYHLDDLNNAANNPTTKKRDTEGIRSTKLIEYYSNSQEENLEYHPTIKNKKKKKKKSKTMETLETMVITNKEVTKSPKKEKTKDKIKKTKPKKQKTTQTTTLTDETTIHETTVDIELQKFENEVRGYTQNQYRPRLTSKTTYQNEKSKDTQFESIKNTQSKSKQTKTQTPTTTANLQKSSKKVEQLNHFAEHLLETSSKFVSKKPTPAYPKHDYIDYKIPSSEFKLSYNPNENVNSEDFSKMYAKFLRNQMTDVDQRSTLDKLTDVIKNIFENRLGSRLMNTNDFNRRLDVPSHNMRALTRSEEDRIYEIIKMMIENRKKVEARSRAYTKLSPYEHEKRSTVHAFNIHKMSPEEKMADVIHKMVDSSLKIQFEKPQMSIGALSETLKNKPYHNHGVNNEFKVSDMIQNLIETKIAEYAKVQTTTKAPHVQRFQTETRGSNSENRPWPSLRPSHETARPGFETRYTALPIRFQTQTRSSDVQAKEIELEYQHIKTSSFKLTEETPFKEDYTSKRQIFQHTQPLLQGSTIKIGQPGPISIVTEDKASDEIKRPVPQVLFLQNTAPTHKPDQLGYFLENRHIETTYAKLSHWPKQTHEYMMEKITPVDKTTKNTETTTIKHSDIRSGNLGNGGGSNNNGIPNVQVVFLNVPQLEPEEERQKLDEKQKNEQRKQEETEKNKEINLEEVSFEVEIQENEKNALRQKIEDEVREKFRKEEQKRMKEIKRLEVIRKEELKRIEEEKKIIEEKRIQEQKRLQAVRQEYEQKVLKQKIEKELREKLRKEEEENRKQEEKRIQEDKRIQEERRQEKAEREEKEKKDYRQKIEDEMKEREALDRQWEKELERKIKAKEMAAAIEALKEEEKKKNEAEKKILDQKILIMQEKLKRDLEETIELKLKKDTPSTDKSTLNYWEQQWQDDQELKLRDAYYKYMKLNNATSGKNEKTVNYWSEQWRIDLENKLREKQKEDNEKTTLTHEIKEHTEELSSTKLASNQSAEDQGKIEEVKPKQIIHNLLPRDILSNKLVGGGRLLKNKKNIATSSAMPKPNRFDARRDESNPDTKTLKLIIRRARDRSDRDTTLREMSDEHTEKNDDVIRSDTIMKDKEIYWVKSQQSEENNVGINEEPTEKDIEVERASDVNISENRMNNDAMESELVIESNEHNILRAKKKKGKLRHKKIKKEKFEVALKGEGKIEDKKVKKNNQKKQVNNEDHRNKDKNEKHKDKKHKKSRHEKKISKEEQNKIINISDENRKNENHKKENKRGKLKTKVHKKIKNKVKIEPGKNNEKEGIEDLKEHKKFKEEDGEIKEQKHKTKHGKRHKKNVEEEEWDREHRLQEEEIKKSKDKKKKEKVKKLDQIKETSKKHKKVKEKHQDFDHSKEKETIHEQYNQSKHTKNKAAELKSEKSERNISNKKKHRNEEVKVKVNKKKEDDDDGAREFDFNLMIGENQNPFIRIPKHKKNKTKSG